MSRPRAAIVPIVLVVVRRGEEFLIVQETELLGRTWYLPAGSVDPGESLIEAAIRETREEAGIDVIPRALLWMEDYTRIDPSGVWIGAWRYVLRAEAVDPDQRPVLSGHTLDARWAALPLRAPEVVTIFEAVERGCPELPLEHVYRYYG